MNKIKAPWELIELSVDLFNCLFALLLLILTLANPASVPGWPVHALKLALALFFYALAAYALKRISGELLHTSLHIALVVGLYAFLFQAIAPLQLIIHPAWLDTHIIALETKLFGGEPSLYLDPYVFPLLTEWMMFAYVVYVPLIPGIAFICYFSANNQAAESYLLTLVIAYAFCYIGFMLFPVATQFYYMPDAYQAQLDGWLFTRLGEWIRENQHYPGGGLPSPHTAAGTVMLIYMYKYNRKIFYILLPVIITLFISTVYGRYHYTSDAILGIITAGIVYGFTRKYIHSFSD